MGIDPYHSWQPQSLVAELFLANVLALPLDYWRLKMFVCETEKHGYRYMNPSIPS
jgi:hypothetical protein